MNEKLDLKKALFAIRSTGIGPALRTLRYTRLRNRVEEAHKKPANHTAPLTPGALKTVRPIPGGTQIEYENAMLEIVILAPNLARVTWQPGILPVPYALQNTAWPIIPVTQQDSPNGLTLSSDQLQVAINKTGELTFSNHDGICFRVDQPPTRQGEAWSLTSPLKEDEHIYGLGERAAPFNLRGGTYQIWNSDPGGSYGPGKDPLYLSTPVYWGMHSQGSYLVFHENSHRGTFSFKNNASILYEGGALRYYMIVGSPAEIIARYTELTGRPEMPPRWALGYHQCRWGYRSETDIRQVIAGFKQHNLPISAIHLDIDYMDSYRVFTFDPERFPNPPQLFADLEKQGVKAVVILDPGVKKDKSYAFYKDGLKRKVFSTLPDGKVLHGLVWPGWSAFPDFTNPETRQWWGEQYQALINLGISGYWHDMNEPASFAAQGDTTLPSVTRHNFDGRGGDHVEAHNLYGFLMNRAAHEALRQYQPNKRPWMLSRAGWAGMQRYAWNWTGDTETSWQALHQTVATLLGLGLSGHFFSGPDIGGFSGNPSAELYLRWFQMAAFMPFFRTHSAIGTARREPWVFGEPTTSIVRQFLNLRYRLLPYLYTAAWQACYQGIPPVRPIFWDAPADPALHSIGDQFLLGDSLMIAPICEEGATSRTVRLPKGEWFNFWDDTLYQGPAEIQMDAPLERIPILVRAGAILPMETEGRLTLHLYPPSAGTFLSQLYTDAGDGYGDWRLDIFEMTRENNTVRITRSGQGQYPFPYSEIAVTLHGPQNIEVNFPAAQSGL